MRTHPQPTIWTTWLLAARGGQELGILGSIEQGLNG